MQQLLEQAESTKACHRGDIVRGVIMHADRDALLVDVGLKSEGVVPQREMRTLRPEEVSQLKVGDNLFVYVINPENAEGQALLSLDKALGEKGWLLLQQHLESGEPLEAEVIGYNKGGVIVSIHSVQGFVPVSQLSSVGRVSEEKDPENNQLGKLMGQTLRLKVLELNKRRNRVILSERAALQEWKQQQKERLLSELKEGETRVGKVTGICNFGVFVDLGGADGLIHVSELSWESVKSPGDVLKLGDETTVLVIKVDQETKKIALSLKRTKPEPWQTMTQRYHEGQLVPGTITKIATFGAFARVESSVEGLIHISELADRPIQHPKEVVKEGDNVTVKILRIDPERRRLALSLRQAEAEGSS